MKKWSLRIIVVGIILVAAVLGSAFYFLNDIVKKGVETVGPKLTKTEVRLGRANLSPFSGNGQLTGFFIGNPEGWKTESAIKVGDVKVALNVGSALSDLVVVESIHIQAPEITFEGGLAGSNLGKILDNLEAAAGGSDAKSSPAEGSSGSTKKFKVKDVVIQGAKVHVNVLGKQMTLPVADVRVQNIGTDNTGVTAAQLTRDILKPLLVAVIKTATDAAGGVGQGLKDVTKSTTDQLDKTTKGITDLLKKK